MNNLLRFLGHQHWIRFGLRDKIIRRYCNPDTVESNEFVMNFFGFKFKGNLNSYLDWNVFFYGAYEREFLLLLRDLIDGNLNPVFIDVGANVGQHSLFLSRFCESVHSFEPNPVVRKKLKDNIRLNSVNNIVVHGVGLGVYTESLPFYFPKGCNQGTGSFIEGYSQNNEKGDSLLKLENGDRYLSQLELEKIDLIKIDVEGFEKNVLTGLRDTINKYRPIITMEYSETTKKSFSCLEELTGLLPEGYKIMRIVCNDPCWGIFNIPKYKLVNFDFDISGGDLLLSSI